MTSAEDKLLSAMNTRHQPLGRDVRGFTSHRLVLFSTAQVVVT